MAATWDNRIVRRADVDPAQLLSNPKNYRRHTKAQKDAFRGLVKQVGYIDPVLVQDGSDVVIDGHLRVEVALEDGIATVPVDYYDGTDAEADLILATKDPLAAMAYHDAQALDELLKGVDAHDEAVRAMLDALRSDSPSADDWADAMSALPDGDKSPFQQMTFTVSDEQAEQITAALSSAKAQGPFVDSGNENSNGNALARICETYETTYGR